MPGSIYLKAYENSSEFNIASLSLSIHLTIDIKSLSVLKCPFYFKNILRSLCVINPV